MTGWVQVNIACLDDSIDYLRKCQMAPAMAPIVIATTCTRTSEGDFLRTVALFLNPVLKRRSRFGSFGSMKAAKAKHATLIQPSVDVIDLTSSLGFTPPSAGGFVDCCSCAASSTSFLSGDCGGSRTRASAIIMTKASPLHFSALFMFRRDSASTPTTLAALENHSSNNAFMLYS